MAMVVAAIVRMFAAAVRMTMSAAAVAVRVAVRFVRNTRTIKSRRCRVAWARHCDARFKVALLDLHNNLLNVVSLEEIADVTSNRLLVCIFGHLNANCRHIYVRFELP